MQNVKPVVWNIIFREEKDFYQTVIDDRLSNFPKTFMLHFKLFIGRNAFASYNKTLRFLPQILYNKDIIILCKVLLTSINNQICRILLHTVKHIWHATKKLSSCCLKSFVSWKHPFENKIGVLSWRVAISHMRKL